MRGHFPGSPFDESSRASRAFSRAIASASAGFKAAGKSSEGPATRPCSVALRTTRLNDGEKGARQNSVSEAAGAATPGISIGLSISMAEAALLHPCDGGTKVNPSPTTTTAAWPCFAWRTNTPRAHNPEATSPNRRDAGAAADNADPDVRQMTDKDGAEKAEHPAEFEPKEGAMDTTD